MEEPEYALPILGLRVNYMRRTSVNDLVLMLPKPLLSALNRRGCSKFTDDPERPLTPKYLHGLLSKQNILLFGCVYTTNTPRYYL